MSSFGSQYILRREPCLLQKALELRLSEGLLIVVDGREGLTALF